MDNRNKVINYIFVEDKGKTISVGEVAKATGISPREVSIIVEHLIEQGLLSDMEECEADDPEAKIGKMIWK